MQSTESNFTAAEIKQCKKHYRDFYEMELGHRLKLDRFDHNLYRFAYNCKDCETKIFSAFCSRADDGKEHFFTITTYGVGKSHWNHRKMESCDPKALAKRKKTQKELAACPELNVLVNDTSLLGGRKFRGVSTLSKQVILVNAGCGDVTLSAIKNATALIKVTPFEHVTGYKQIVPYYEQWKTLNPNLAYDIEPKGEGVFSRLVVVLPYTVNFLPNMLNVFGLDAGFMPKVPITGLSASQLQALLGDKELRPVASDREYVLANLTLTIVTGLTLNHNRILLAYCLGYGENADDTRFLLQFLLENGGGAIDNKNNVIMSDRGACAGPVDEVFLSAWQHYCPKHLERNLKTRHFDKPLLDLFWKARCATKKSAYEAAMARMENIPTKGAAAAEYLRSIPKWQVHVFAEKGIPMHEIKSDNLVEGPMSNNKDARCQASPIFLTNCLAVIALQTIRTAQENTPRTGLLTPRAMKLSIKYWEKSKQYVVEMVSDAQCIAKYQGASTKQADLYNVNLDDKTCDCQHWQQSGCPCAHAWRAIAPGDIVFNARYYYEFCLLSRQQAMFSHYRAMQLVNMTDVRNLIDTKDYSLITPRTELIPLTGKSSKRCRSAGDSSAGGGLSQSAVAKLKKKECACCTKHIAVSNEKHAYSEACVKHAKRRKKGSLHTNKVTTLYYDARATIVPVASSNSTNSDGSGSESNDSAEISDN